MSNAYDRHLQKLNPLCPVAYGLNLATIDNLKYMA